MSAAANARFGVALLKDFSERNPLTRFKVVVAPSREIVYGVSANQRSWYDNSNALRLGYRPQDDSEPYAEEILRKEKPSSDAIAEAHQGGVFCSAEQVPNPAAPKKKGKRK